MRAAKASDLAELDAVLALKSSRVLRPRVLRGWRGGWDLD